MRHAADDRSQAWSKPWQDLQRTLAAAAAGGGAAPRAAKAHATTSVGANGSWLMRAHHAVPLRSAATRAAGT